MGLSLISDTSLNADFASLLLSICHILDNSPNQKPNLRKCKGFCHILGTSDDSTDLLLSDKNIAKIKQCSKFEELFEILIQYMSWDEHSILTQIVKICNSAESQREIEHFEKKLALYQGLQILSSTSQQELAKDIVESCIIIDKPYRSITIEEYNNIKTLIISNQNVHSYATVGFIKMLYH